MNIRPDPPAESVDPWRAAEEEADRHAEAGQPRTLQDAVIDIVRRSMAAEAAAQGRRGRPARRRRRARRGHRGRGMKALVISPVRALDESGGYGKPIWELLDAPTGDRRLPWLQEQVGGWIEGIYPHSRSKIRNWVGYCNGEHRLPTNVYATELPGGPAGPPTSASPARSCSWA